jgi:hydrogenase maturation protease
LSRETLKLPEVAMKKTLLLGFGNIDRQDDGVAWHVLESIARKLGRPVPDPSEGFYPNGCNPAFMFVLQLTPELAETIAEYDRVAFIDAHTGDVDADLQILTLQAAYEPSPLTHHLTPASCLALVETIYHKSPEAMLFSVRGFQFDFEKKLSIKTDLLASRVVKEILEWMNN